MKIHVNFFKLEKWINAEILSIDVENQEAEVYYILNKEKITVSSILIKLIEVPNQSLF